MYNGSHVSSNKKSFTFGNGFEMEETSFHHRGNLLAKTYHLAFNVQVTYLPVDLPAFHVQVT